jgi:protein-tyrosine phosphatase|eukprot:g4495.t1
MAQFLGSGSSQQLDDAGFVQSPSESVAQGTTKKYRMTSNQAGTSLSSVAASAASAKTSVKVAPLQIFWLKTSKYGNLAMSSLPGRLQQKDVVGAEDRSASLSQFVLRSHLANLVGTIGITDIFLFCTSYELERYLPGVDVIAEVGAYGAVLHHFPVENGHPPSAEDCAIIHERLQNCIRSGKTVLMSSKLGYGRAPTVLAAYLLAQTKGLSPDQAMQLVREARGNAAVQTVKQYNFLHEYFMHLYAVSFEEMQTSEHLAALCGTSPGNKRTVPLP